VADERDPGVHAHVEHAGRFRYAEVPHVAKAIATADGHRPEAQDRHAQTALAEKSLFHARSTSSGLYC
jgi:protein involved in polysaccharide export with SLBB domain